MSNALSQQEVMALSYLKDGVAADTGSIAEVCCLSTEAARRMLSKLKERKLVADVDPQRERNVLWWQITEKGTQEINASFFDRTEGFPRLVSGP